MNNKVHAVDNTRHDT